MRAFIAIELPESVKRKLEVRIAGFQDGMVDQDVKWVRPESIHLTLKFLGEVDPETAATVKGSLAELARDHRGFSVSIGGFGCFPNMNQPRVFWIGVDADHDRLLQLQSDLESRLASAGIPRERRTYHPHLTIGRTRRGLPANRLRALSDWASSTNVNDLGSLEVNAVSLVRSDLRSSGAIYTTLHQARLAS